MSFKNINQLIGITGIRTQNVVPINQIRIVRGGGYTGSWYYANFETNGQWYADNTAIKGATSKLFIMKDIYEGKAITFRSGAIISNSIQKFIPSMIVGLTAQFDANSLSNNSSTDTTLWPSKVGSLFWQQSDGKYRPIKSTNDVTGLPSVAAYVSRSSIWAPSYFGYMYLSNSSLLPNGISPSHVFAACYFGKVRNNPSQSAPEKTTSDLIGWGDGTNNRHPIRRTNSNNQFSAVGNNGSASVTVLNSYKQNRIVSSFMNGSSAELAIDGGEKAITTGLDNNTVGKYGYLFRGTSSTMWTGSINEILIYNRKINEENRARIEGYLAHKWRLAYLLSDDHPYKFVAPDPLETPEQDYTIAITTGSGYTGSVVTHYFDEPGRWYFDNVPVSGSTGTQKTITISNANEGKAIEFRSENYTSNTIQLFTPSVVPGLISWIDAYAGSGSWTTSKVGNHQLTLSNVSYLATGRNGLPAATPSTTSGYAVYNKSEHMPSGSKPSNIFAIANFNNNNVTERNLIVWGDYNNTQSRRVLGKAANNRVQSYAGSQILDAGTDPSGIWMNYDKIVSSSIANGIIENVINGGAITVQASIAENLNTDNSVPAIIFNNSTPGSNTAWQGSMQELMVFDEKVSPTNRKKIEGYLAHKWGLMALLPEDHPYKLLPPKFEEEVETTSTIYIQTGNGLAGSTYYADFEDAGQWYIDDMPIDGETDWFFTMRPEFEGRKITFRTETETSNSIIMFVPENIGSLIGWFDVSDNSTLVVDEENRISRWNSKISDDFFVYNDTPEEQPVLVQDGMNGFQSITTGAGKYFIFNDPTKLPMGSTPSHFFTTFLKQSSQTGEILYYGNASTGYRRLYSSTGSNLLIHGSTTSTSAINNYTTSPEVLASVFISNRAEITINGRTTSSSNGATFNTLEGETNFLFTNNNVNSWFNGYFQELFIFNEELSKGFQQKMEGYMAAKWNLFDNLANVHPYKTEYPTITEDEYTVTKLIQLDTFTIRTVLKDGSWYADGVSLENSSNTLNITQDLMNKEIYYVSYGLETERFKIVDDTWDFNTDPGIAAWYDASDALTITKDSNDLVSSWESKVGTGLAAIQTTDLNKPSYIEDGLNNLPTIYADGQNSWLKINSGIAIADQTAFAILKTNDNSTGGSNWYVCPGIWGSEQSGVVADFGWGLNSGYPIYGTYQNTMASTATAYNVNINKPVIVGFDRTSSTGAINHWFNYKANGSGILDKGPRTASTTSAIFSMAGNSVSATMALAAGISELLIFDKVLTKNERERVEGKLAWKWKLMDELPDDHQYKNIPLVTYPGTPNTISIIKGSGSTGSYYYAHFTTNGQWYADGEPISGAIFKAFVMKPEYVGKAITFKSGSIISNEIKLWIPNTNGIKAWMDASITETLDRSFAGSGSNVIRWRSRVGDFYAENVTTSKTNKPIYRSNGRNGLPDLYTVSSAKYLEFNSINLPHSTDDSFVIASTYTTTYPSGNQGLLSWGTTQIRRHINVNQTDNTIFCGANLGIASQSISTIKMADTDHIISSSLGSAPSNIYVDGSLHASGSATSAIGSTSSSTNVGRIFSGASYWFGSLSELIIYDRIPSTIERIKLDGYLAHKWKMADKLPTYHPYKNAPPLPYVSDDWKTEIKLVSGMGDVGSKYFTYLEGGEWYLDNSPTGITTNTITITYDICGGDIEYRTSELQSDRVYIPSIVFDYTTMSSMLGSFDSSDPTLITKDENNLVSRWTPKKYVGANYYANQATQSLQPKYDPTGLDSVRPTIISDGIDDRLTTSFSIANAANSTIFAIAKTASTVKTQVLSLRPAMFGYMDSFSRPFTYGVNNGKPFVHSYSQTSTAPINALNKINDNTKKMVSFTRDTTSGEVIHYTNGNTNGSAIGITGNQLSSGTHIFTSSTSPLSTWDGGISELVFFDSVLSETDRQKVEGVLAWKWGLQEQLPENHPYKTKVPEHEHTIRVIKGGTYDGTILQHSFTTAGQWYADDEPIVGESKRTFTVKIEQMGKSITFRDGINVSNAISFNSWTPKELGTEKIVMWMDANDDNSLIFFTGSSYPGNQVMTWKSKIGNIDAYNGSSSTTVTYSTTGRNNLPALLASGTQYLTVRNGSGLMPMGSTDSFAFSVAYNINATHKSLAMYGSAGTNNSRTHMMCNTNGRVAVTGTYNDTIGTQTSITWNNVDKIVASKMSGTGAALYVDGAINATVTNSTAYNTTNLTYNSLFSGYNNNYKWNGSCQEYILLNADLVQTDRQKVEGYLAHKWALTALLPSNHPYKTVKPTV